MIVEEGLWYVQKGSRVQGPFTADEVGRFLLLGRVRNTDRVSRDGELWEPVTQVPELIPEALLDLGSDSGWANYLAQRTAGDERAQASTGESSHTRPVAAERRDNAANALARTRADWGDPPLSATSRSSRQSNEVPRPPPRPASLLPWSLLGITLAALGVVLWLNATAASG